MVKVRKPEFNVCKKKLPASQKPFVMLYFIPCDDQIVRTAICTKGFCYLKVVCVVRFHILCRIWARKYMEVFEKFPF